MDPQDFNVNSRLRASDSDRETAAAVINNALAEGRLTPEEHSQRLDAIFAAKTHAELVPVLDDLPVSRGVRQEIARPQPADANLAPRRRRRLVAILSGFGRDGAWHPEPEMTIVTVLGGAGLDFRDAVLPGKEVVLRITCVLGGLGIIVPPEMRVIDNTSSILGGSGESGDAAEVSDPDAPVLRLEGVCILGGMGIERKARKAPKELRRSKGASVSIEAGPVIRIKGRDSDD